MEDAVQEKQVSNKPLRAANGQLLPGQTANPNGRPKGKSLKEFAREYLMGLPDEEKADYLATLPKEIVWKMAEGNPHQDVANTIELAPTPLLNAIRDHDSNKKNSEVVEADTGGAGRDISGEDSGDH